MINNNYDLVMPKGDSEIVAVALEEIPMGGTAEFIVCSGTDFSDEIIRKSISALDEEGLTAFVLDPNDTKNIKAGTYEYRIKVLGFDGSVKTQVLGHTLTLV